MATKKSRSKKRNKGFRRVHWLKTRTKALSYSGSLRKYLMAVLGDETKFGRDHKSNWERTVERLDAESPGIFTNPQGSLYRKFDKESVIDMIYHHASQIRKNLKKKGLQPTHEDLLRAVVNTSAFVSQEELIQNNIETFFRKRKNKKFFEDFKEVLRQMDPSFTRIDYSKFKYRNDFRVMNENGMEETVKAYVLGDTGVGLTLVGSGSKESPIIFNIGVEIGQ